MFLHSSSSVSPDLVTRCHLFLNHWNPRGGQCPLVAAPKYHLHVCSQPIPIPASPDMIQMIRISGALSEKKRTWHQNIWRYLTLLSVGIFYWWLPLSKYWTSINILEMWAGAPAGDIVCTVLATLTPSMTKRAWNEGDFCIGDPISCLLTMGSTPI